MTDHTYKCPKCGASLQICTDSPKIMEKAVREFESKHSKCKKK